MRSGTQTIKTPGFLGGMVNQTQNQNQKQDRRETRIHPAHVTELSSADVAVEEREIMTLDYERYGDEIAETIEMLFKVELCTKNPGLASCSHVPDVIRVSISLQHRDFVTARIGESKRVTYIRDGKVIVRAGNAVLLVDTRFVLFNFHPDGSLVPQAKSVRLTWHGSEEVFDAYEFRKMIRDAIVAIVDIARDVLQS